MVPLPPVQKTTLFSEGVSEKDWESLGWYPVGCLTEDAILPDVAEVVGLGHRHGARVMLMVSGGEGGCTAQLLFCTVCFEDREGD